MEALHLKASAALAAASEAGEKNRSERDRLIRIAERDARRIEAMDWSVATPLAHLIHAGAASLPRSLTETELT